jgi:hypothetical protein
LRKKIYQNEGEDMTLEKKLHDVSMRCDMDTTNTVDTFEEVGMANPWSTKKSFLDALSHVKTFDFYTGVYGEVPEEFKQAISNGEHIKPPKTRFVPSRTLIRKMMRAVVKYGDQGCQRTFLLRFGLPEEPSAFL